MIQPHSVCVTMGGGWQRHSLPLDDCNMLGEALVDGVPGALVQRRDSAEYFHVSSGKYFPLNPKEVRR